MRNAPGAERRRRARWTRAAGGRDGFGNGRQSAPARSRPWPKTLVTLSGTATLFLAGPAGQERGIQRGQDLRQGQAHQRLVLGGVVVKRAGRRSLPQFAERNPDRAGGQLRQSGLDGKRKCPASRRRDQRRQIRRKRGEDRSQRQMMTPSGPAGRGKPARRRRSGSAPAPGTGGMGIAAASLGVADGSGAAGFEKNRFKRPNMA